MSWDFTGNVPQPSLKPPGARAAHNVGCEPPQIPLPTTKTKGLPAVARRDTIFTLVSTALTSGGWRAACAVVYAAVLVQPRGPEVATGVRIDTERATRGIGAPARGSLESQVEFLGGIKLKYRDPTLVITHLVI